MKALVYTGVEALALQEVPDPVPAADEVLVRIDSVGICGSDMHAFLGHDERRPAPLILGSRRRWCHTADGRRVTINPLVTCGTCPACRAGRENLCSSRQIISMPPREGAFAEAVAIPNAIWSRCRITSPLPKPPWRNPWRSAGMRCGWACEPPIRDAIRRAGHWRRCHWPCRRAEPCAQGVTSVTISDPNPLRRAYLVDQGPFDIIAPEDLGNRLFDLTVDAVGFDATRATASAATRPGGVILHIGLGGGNAGFDLRRLTLQEITVIGTYTYTAQDFRDTCAAMFDGRLGPLGWTETRALSDGAAAFADIRAGQTAAPKILLKP